MLRNDIVKHVIKVECYSDRFMFVKISAKPVGVVIVKVYMPTTDHDDNEIDKMYDEIGEMHQEGREVNAIVMGNFNSIEREGFTNKVLGPFGLGKRNKRESRWSSTSAGNTIC